MRFADEPAERAPSRQISRANARAPVETGEFDLAIERLTEPSQDLD